MWGRGTVLGGRYTLAERIGGGAMGEVWRALDGVLERAVAVKILLPKLLEDPQFAARFRREAKVLASLSHPGIVDVHDYGEEPAAEEGGDRIAYIVMALVDGHPLDEVREDEGPMPVGRALGIVAETLDALHAAHRRGIVHRDLKPSNLMLREDGRVTVTDFGIAHSKAASRLTASHAVLGTALYIAPEQAEGIATVPASDLYSLGVVAYELLTGNVPFNGDTVLEIVLKHIREPAPELPSGFPEPVRAFVARALSKSPEERWADASEMAKAARTAVAGRDRSEEDDSVGGRPLARPSRPRGAAPSPKRADRGGAARPVPGASPGAGLAAYAGPIPGPDPTEAPTATPDAAAAAAPDASPPTPDTAGAAAPPAPAPAPMLVSGPAPDGGPTTVVPPSTPWWQRHRTAVLVVVPVVLAALTITVVNLMPGEKEASGAPSSARPPGATAAPDNGPPPKTNPTKPSSPAPGTPSAPKTGPAKDAAGGTGATAAGGDGKQAGNAGKGDASSASTGGTDSGSHPGTGTGTGNKPAPPPAGPAKPANCGGDSWGAITNVGTGRKMGLANASSTGTGGKVVSGGNTQFGWVRSGNQFDEFHACNLAGSALALKQAPAYDEKTGTVLSTTGGYTGYVTGWKTTPASGGAHQINYYVGDGCVTDVGAGRQLTVEACTSGNKAQLWRLP